LDSATGKTTRKELHEGSLWKRVPGFAKILILAQTVIILFMGFWIYEEYLNNVFLQAYVNGLFQGDALTAIILISAGAFATVAIILYARLRRTRKLLEAIISKETIGSYGGRLGEPLDKWTEQHLIEMIRKTSPIQNSRQSTSGQMPTLRRKGSQDSTRKTPTNRPLASSYFHTGPREPTHATQRSVAKIPYFLETVSCLALILG